MAHVCAALFDLDGTLVATEHRSRAAWTRMFGAHGVEVNDDVLATFVGRRAQESLADHVHKFPGSTVQGLLDEAVGHLDGPDIPPPYPVPGARALVEELHSRGTPIGVVTSGLRAHASALLDHVGGADLFSVMITAEDVRRGKPDPEGFLAGCAALGVVPSQTVAFEDAPAGVAAAKAAGLLCVGLTTTHDASALGGADVVTTDYTELA
ncbi:haloacid dehalogenase [Pseudonocardia sp. HH130630-07]|nr:haloacid dehalogenase [Pseudonocardia sp. HH130630-07]